MSRARPPPTMRINNLPPRRQQEAAEVVKRRNDDDSILQYATKRFPNNTSAYDALTKFLHEAKLLHATQHMRELMIKDAIIPGGIFSVDHESFPQEGGTGTRLMGEGDRLSTMLKVTRHDDIRLLNGHTEIDASVKLGKHTELHFCFRRVPVEHVGTKLPHVQHADDDDDQEEHPPEVVDVIRNTTRVHYEIEANIGPADPRRMLLGVAITGVHPSGMPSPAGVVEEGHEEEFDPDLIKDPYFVYHDPEVLGAVMDSIQTTFSEMEFLSFLMLFPYHEEEWDVAGCVMDQLLGSDDDEEEEEEMEDMQLQPPPTTKRKKSPAPPPKKGGAAAKKGQKNASKKKQKKAKPIN